MHRRALAIHLKALGEDHPYTATSYTNLANTLWAQGKYAEAVPLLQRALMINEQAQGPEHRQLATSLNDLAALDLDLI